jgi:hypothetical protein
MITLLRLCAADLTLLLAGHAIAGPPARRLRLPLLPLLAISLISGCGLLAVLTTLLGVIDGPTDTWPVTGLLLGALALVGLAPVARALPALRRPVPRWSELRWLPYAVSVVVAARFAVTAWRSPIHSNDEYMMWALRGRMLAAGHLEPLVFGSAADPHLYQSREYPLGLPALYSWVYGWIGPRAAEFGAHLQVPLLGCCALIVAVWALQTTNRITILTGCLIAPAFFAVTWVGRYTGILLFADLPVAAAALVVVLLVHRWLDTGDATWLVLAVGPAVAGLYFKEEGLLFIAAPCLVASLAGLLNRRPRWWLPLILLGVGLLARLPWQLWLATEGLRGRFLRAPLPQYSTGDQLHLTRLVGDQLIRDWPIPYPFWLLLLILVLGVALAVLRPAGRRSAAYLGGTLALIVAGIWTQYTITAVSSEHASGIIPSYMSFNAPRVLLLPTVLVWLIALLPAGAPLDEPPPPAADPESDDLERLGEMAR